MEKNVFQKIIDRELPAEILYEDDSCIVILNRFPNIPGETLVITKKSISYVFDLDESSYHHLFGVARKIASALDSTFDTLRTCLVVEGFDVPQVHIRLYPQTDIGLVLSHGIEATDAELKSIGNRIREHLD